MQIVQVQALPAICAECDKGISFLDPQENLSGGGWAVEKPNGLEDS